MKKFKILPTVLMLIMCVGVLAVGIFAMTPMHNDIDAIIAVKGVNSPVKIEVFIDNTSGPALITYDEVRKGEDIELDEISKELLKFAPEGVNTLNEVPPKKLILRVTNLDSSKQLGAYFLEEELAANTLINTKAEVLTEDGTLKVADAHLPSYTVLDKNNQTNTEPKATQDLVIELNMATWDDAEGDLFLYLYIEEYGADLETEYEKTTGSVIVAPTAQAQALSTLSTPVFENATLTASDIASINFANTPNIVIVEGVTNFGSIFSGKIGLKSVILPNTVTALAASAFSGCADLIGVQFSNDVTEIGSNAFEGCSQITEIQLPKNTTVLNAYVFKNCPALTSLVIPEGITTIKSYAIDGCSELKSVVIPNSVTTIETYAIRNCNKLEEITLPLVCRFVLVFGGGGVIPATLKSVVITKGTSVANNEFDRLTSITNVSLPEGVITISDSAFYGCTALSLINIPTTVTTIGVCAFFGCTALTSITIPENVTTIGMGAFSDCYSLTEINYNAANCELNQYSSPFSRTSTGSNAVVNIGERVTQIPQLLFGFCDYITAVVFDNNSICTDIRMQAFYKTSITEITIPVSVTTIGNAAFRDSALLTSVTISEGLTTIGNGALYNCNNLKTITVAKNTDLTSAYYLPTLTQTGKTFKGWYTNENGTGTAVTKISADKYTAETTYYAVWQ